MPARLVSIINMKGGVGKSTTTVSLAETLALHRRRRVLIIDLDPQTNASIMAAGPEKWNAMREAERTLDFYFESYIVQQRPKPFKSLIEAKVSDLKGPQQKINTKQSSSENKEEARIEHLSKLWSQL